MWYFSSHKQKGFTLIEVMVAVSIFAIISTIGVGSLLSINEANKRARSQRTAVDSMNFVLDSMARDIRTGYNYTCGPDPTAATRTSCYKNQCVGTFSFIDQDSNWVTYDVNPGNDSIRRRIYALDGTLQRSDDLTNPAFLELDTLTNGLCFRMKGTDNSVGNFQQPFVAISIAGTANVAGHLTELYLQTSVTQRALDVES